MKKAVLFIFCIVSISQTFAQQTSQALPDSLHSITLPAEMDRVLRDYERAWQSKNTEELVKLFTVDGFVLQPRHGPARGKNNLMQAYRNSGGAPLYLRALSFSTSDSIGYIIGGYRASQLSSDIGKFILLLRKGPNEKWLIAADMDNSNR